MYFIPQSHKFENVPSKEQVYSHIEAAGRTCYQSEPKGDPEGFIRMIIKRGHESVLEHIALTCRIVTDRGISHEIVRHRIASYSQESTRYCCYKGDIGFIGIQLLSYNDEAIIKVAYEAAEKAYHDLLNRGILPQIARCVLPNGLKTEIVMTMNLREWRHFFRLRTAPAAHPQMRALAIPMLDELKELYPVVFEDILVKE